MNMKRSPLRALASAALGTLLLGLAACPGPSAPAGGERDCPDGPHVIRSCETEFDYDALKGDVNIDVAGVFGVNGGVATEAIRKVDVHLQDYVAKHKRACEDYNTCILTTDEFRARTEALDAQMTGLRLAYEAMGRAKSADEAMRILQEFYRTSLPPSARTEDVTFRLGVYATLPDGRKTVVQPGSDVPTGSQMHFTVQTSQDAHIYMFQVTPDGMLHVLYPEPRIGTSNPLRGKTTKRIPDSNQSFTVTDDTEGLEKVFFVVSRTVVPEVEQALVKARSQEGVRVSDDPILANIASVVPSTSAEQQRCPRLLSLTGNGGGETGSSSCKKPRSLQLSQGSGTSQSSGPEPVSMAVSNELGDDLIVEVFTFNQIPR